MTKADRAALAAARAVAALAALAGGLRAMAPSASPRLGLLAAGVAALLLAVGAPRLVLPVARPLHRALVAVGDALSTVALSALYLAVVVPLALVLRAAGRLPPSEEPWPPPDQTGWTPWEDASSGRRASGAGVLAGVAARAASAFALLRFLHARPTAYLVPLVALLLLLGAVVLLGQSTGLGPLVYTLF